MKDLRPALTDVFHFYEIKGFKHEDPLLLTLIISQGNFPINGVKKSETQVLETAFSCSFFLAALISCSLSPSLSGELIKVDVIIEVTAELVGTLSYKIPCSSPYQQPVTTHTHTYRGYQRSISHMAIGFGSAFNKFKYIDSLWCLLEDGERAHSHHYFIASKQTYMYSHFTSSSNKYNTNKYIFLLPEVLGEDLMSFWSKDRIYSSVFSLVDR